MVLNHIERPATPFSSRRTPWRWLLILLTLAALTAPATQAQTAVVLCDSHNPPYLEGKENGNVATGGRVVRLLDEVFKRVDGATVEIRLMPWVRCLKEAELGKKDGVAKLFKNPERAEYLDFTTEPVFLMVNRVFYLEESFPQGLEWESVADLAQYRIGVTEGSSYGADVDRAIADGVLKVDTVSTDVQSMKKLLGGRLDLVLNDGIMGATHARNAGGADRIKASEQALSTDPAFIGISKTSEARQLLPAIDQALAQLREEGVSDRIMRGE